jgi:hypothetical protein
VATGSSECRPRIKIFWNVGELDGRGLDLALICTRRLRHQAGVEVALPVDVTVDRLSVERRERGRADRRNNSRSGRRQTDRHLERRWRRAAWLFAAYATLLSLRALPSNIRRRFNRTTA